MSISFSLVPYSGGPTLIITDEDWPTVVAPIRTHKIDGVSEVSSLAVRRYPSRDELYLVCGTVFHNDTLVAVGGDVVPEGRIREMLNTVAERMRFDGSLVDDCQKELDRLHIG
jgi:hypothetical protein